MTEEAVNPFHHIRLDVFEGPLDLLLHLIKENQLDIYNIPISQITQQYLHYLDMMKTLNLDIAGDFLVMAATLAHIKSQMLLPAVEGQEDLEEQGKDPRGELVRRLLEYQKYKDAAAQLFSRPLLYRDVFKREKAERNVPQSDAPPDLVEISVFKLVEALHRVMENVRLHEPHEVSAESVTVSQRVHFIAQAIRSSSEGAVQFQELFAQDRTQAQVVVTFLALLEMIKMGLLRAFQAEAFSDIQLLGTANLYGEWNYDRNNEFDAYAAQVHP